MKNIILKISLISLTAIIFSGCRHGSPIIPFVAGVIVADTIAHPVEKETVYVTEEPEVIIIERHPTHHVETIYIDDDRTYYKKKKKYKTYKHREVYSY